MLARVLSNTPAKLYGFSNPEYPDREVWSVAQTAALYAGDIRGTNFPLAAIISPQ